MGRTYAEWAEGHQRKGSAQGREQGCALVVRRALRKFGAETAKRLEGLVGATGPEQLANGASASR